MLLRPNTNCEIQGVIEYDDFSQPVLGPTVKARCAVVKLLQGVEKTSVRADSSASRGAAREIVADSRLLFPPNTVIQEGDKIVIMGITIRVKSVWPRQDIDGTIDHLQVDADKWE